MINKLNIKDSHILLVDDRKENLLVLETILKKEGYKVDKCLSGKSAVKKSLKYSYDLFILDVQMPKMDGFELAGYFKGVKRTRDIPIIFVTAPSQEKHIIKDHETGAVDYLMKPVVPELIKLKVKAFLQLYHQQRQLHTLNNDMEVIVAERTKELEQSRERLREITETIKEVFWLIDWKTKKLLYVSPAYEEIYGKSCESLYRNAKSWMDVIHIDDRERVAKEHMDKGERGEHNIEFRVVHPNGKIKWVHERAFPIKEHNTVIRMAGYTVDITDNKTASLHREVSYNIARAASNNIGGLRSISRLIYKELSKVINISNFYIALHDVTNNQLKFPFMYYKGVDHSKEKNWAFSNGITEHIIKTRRGLFIKNKELKQLAQKNKIKFRGEIPAAFLGVPLKHLGRILGVIAVQSDSDENMFRQDDFKLLNFASVQIASVLEKQMMFDELKSSGEKFRSLANNAPNIILKINQRGVIEYTNREVEDFGRRMIGKSMYKWIDKKHHVLVKKKVREVFTTGQPQQYELAGLAVRGEPTYYFSNIGAVKDSRGKIRSAIIITQDITKRKKTEIQLQFSDVILKNTENFILVADMNGEIIYVSPSLLSTFKYSLNEVLGTNWYSIAKSTKKEARSKITYVKRAARGEIPIPPPYETILYDKSGQPRDVLWQDARGPGNMLIGMGTDITSRKLTEKDLVLSELRYKSVVRQSLTAIYMLDPKSKRIIEANDTFIDYLGYTRKDLENLTIYNFIEHDKENINEYLKDTLKLNKVDIGERTWRKKNGEKISVLVSASTVVLANKSIIVVTASDITAQKQTEEKLQMRNHELDTFVYKASHDLRSPLASVLGLINLSRDEIQDKAALEFLDLIHKSMHKLDEILEDLTQLTIIRQGKIEIGPIKITPFIRDIVRGFDQYPQFSEIDIQINSNLKRAFQSDSRLLKTILRNIIENAIKYRKYGSEDSRIEITIRRGPKMVIIKIMDNGMGISKEYQKNIFDMFFRATEISSGSGLGLYIVKSAVEKLDGIIEIESDKKKGATFSIYLPEYEVP